ncbi:MAG: M20 family metallopeptidase [Microbacterium arborescens]
MTTPETTGTGTTGTDTTGTVALLERLVTVDSTNPGGDESGAADVLAEVLRSVGASVAIEEYAPGHVNLVAEVRFGDGPRVMFNSHLDVVPAGSGWSSDPFMPVVRDGRLYGRGAADAKGSLAAMAGAFVDIVRSGSATRGTLVFTAVGDEEVGSTGARALVETLRADACIVGEPTGLRLLAAHKGSLRPVIEVIGRGAHAAAPHNGVNAITGTAALLRALDAHAGELAERDASAHRSPHPDPRARRGRSGTRNAVPEKCTLTIDRRMIPGETADGVRAEIDGLLAEFNAENAPVSARIAALAPSTGGPSETPVDDPFVVACRAALRTVGESDEVGGLVVNCDMTTFRGAGIPTIVFGPGELEVMHAADEFVPLDQLERAPRRVPRDGRTRVRGARVTVRVAIGQAAFDTDVAANVATAVRLRAAASAGRGGPARAVGAVPARIPDGGDVGRAGRRPSTIRGSRP